MPLEGPGPLEGPSPLEAGKPGPLEGLRPLEGLGALDGLGPLERLGALVARVLGPLEGFGPLEAGGLGPLEAGGLGPLEGLEPLEGPGPLEVLEPLDVVEPLEALGPLHGQGPLEAMELGRLGALFVSTASNCLHKTKPSFEAELQTFWQIGPLFGLQIPSLSICVALFKKKKMVPNLHAFFSLKKTFFLRKSSPNIKQQTQKFFRVRLI